MNRYETVALWSYVVAVAFSACGPVIHYTGWSLCLLALVANRLIAKEPFLPRQWGSGAIFKLLLALFLWSCFCLTLGAPSFYSWGKEASVFLEMLLGVFFAIRLLNSPQRRRLFGSVLLGASVVLTIHSLLMYFHLVAPLNRTLENGNVLGFFGLFLSALLPCGALWAVKRPLIALVMLCCAPLLTILSFSSGAWIGSAVQAVVILLWAIRAKKISLRAVATVVLAVGVFLVGANELSRGVIGLRFQEEVAALSAIDDLDRFTTLRNKIWEQSWVAIKERPWLGHGEPFQDFSARLVARRGHGDVHGSPHTAYLYLLYVAGIPGLVLFCLAGLATLKKCLALIPNEMERCQRNADMPWALLTGALMIGQAVYSVSGDIFQARRDLAVPFWALWGLVILLDYPETPVRERELQDACSDVES